ncbi:MAG: CDP-glycerol glycerophosphotransferase family protein [Alphaproteobacteria bacterium]|nr:CDP-glycerol glycerophosphotransferase family protein [Alphaproteobacteria bacterium]
MCKVLKSLFYKNRPFSYELANKLVGKTYAHKKVNKIAVMIFTPGQEKRLDDILYYLDSRKIDIVYAPDPVWCTCDGIKALKKYAESRGYGVKNILEILCRQETYSLTISFGMWFGQKLDNAYLPNLIADSHIKLLYSLGADKTLLAKDKVFMFDKILCYGSYQRKKLEKVCDAEIFEVGNSRLDKYFSTPHNPDILARQLGLDEKKKTILWLPTAYHNSIEEFITIFENLETEYNIVVSPHSLTLEPDINILKNSKLKHVLNAKEAGNLELYALADFVCADYGGAMFTALCLDKNMVLLNIRQHIKKVVEIYGEDTAELYFRKNYIRGYYNDEYEKLRADLSDENVWTEQKKLRMTAKAEFFTDKYEGHSAYVTAKILREALENDRLKGKKYAQ